MSFKVSRRRAFLKTLSTAGVGSLAFGLGDIGALRPATTLAALLGEDSNQRANSCAKLRREVAEENRRLTPANLLHPTNGDEDKYQDKIASYSKALPHNNDGTVDIGAYAALLNALHSGNPRHFDLIPIGGDRKLINPQSGLAFDLEGADSQCLIQPPPPPFQSRELAAEINENYWMALLRDVPFSHYDSAPLAHAAAADLTLFGSDFKGPRRNGQVTPTTLFRGLTPGDLIGPYLSQFFYQPCHFGANVIDRKMTTVLPGLEYMTDFASWLSVQRGFSQSADQLDPVPRYMRNGRDLGQWVHVDVLFQAYLQACLVLIEAGAPFDSGNPYQNNPNQIGFGTFGAPHLAALLCEVSTRALKTVWYQKWFIHRRLRPEVFAARVDRSLYHGAGYPIDQEIFNSLSSIDRLGGYFSSGNAFLPMAYPEGSPAHPSYGAGHATVAGACVTVLKAWFDETTRFVDVGLSPLQPTTDGTNLLPYDGSDSHDMTVGGELNKIASNVAIGRNMAGVHWRSDATASLKLGEEVAIRVLRDHKRIYNEPFDGFSLTRFDGTLVSV